MIADYNQFNWFIFQVDNLVKDNFDLANIEVKKIILDRNISDSTYHKGDVIYQVTISFKNQLGEIKHIGGSFNSYLSIVNVIHSSLGLDQIKLIL